MSAFNSHDFTAASIEVDGYNGKVTDFGVFATGLLFTAYYSAANTITLQFTSTDPAFLTAASSTTSLYTLAGPSAPSITSISFSAGTRLVTLNLSGPLVSTNTYTLKIADWTVLNGEQANFSGLVVDVILPLDLNCVGVGIAQPIDLGIPSVVGQGTAQAVGFSQPIDLGVPVITTLVADTGVGIAQAIALGTPVLGLFLTAHGVGIAQVIALGTPVATQQQEPQGVGFVETIALGTPVVDGNPEPFSGVGISQVINFGTPVVFNGNVHGVGFVQSISLGTPVMSATNQLLPHGVGIQQDILLGDPVMSYNLHLHVGVIGIEQEVAIGAPFVAGAWLQITVGQAAGFPDLDAALQKAFGEGTSGPVNPDLLAPIPDFKDKFTTLQQHQTKLIFEEVAAAILASTGIPGILSDTAVTASTTVATVLGTNTLTWVDGILTGSTEFDLS